jgi:predicted O-linked N-acetylglucosamine transferase (SPINDLY family)
MLKRALAIDPLNHSNWHNLGNVHYLKKNHASALVSYEQALESGTEENFLKGHYIYTKLHVGDWHGFDDLISNLTRDIRAGKPVSAPFAILALVDDPEIQQQAITTFAADKFPSQKDLPPPETHPAHKRIRIGYFSTDYRNHPVAHLMLGLFNAHDRSRFEVIAFSLGNPIKDKWHQRVKDSVDQFIEIQDMSDKEVAELARSMEIDIAVDLNGFTEHCRAGIFAQRAAPVQVSYIGYLGTMGVPYMDYLVTDETIVPPEARPFYNEKMIYLPSYQINDPTLQPSERPMTRAEFGLPEDAFVFCAFNNNFKITPRVFERWMRILNRVPQGVLWLFVSNEKAQEYLRAFAADHGVDPGRLIFASKIPLEEHLARQRLGDLFLDTLPYNAGATASNALRVELPVLTLTGKSFAGRMGSSLLKAVGLSELITATEEAYEDKAVQLASDPALMQSIRHKLANNLPTSALFDNQAFARHIETAFQTIHQRACQALPHMHVLVKP